MGRSTAVVGESVHRKTLSVVPLTSGLHERMSQRNLLVMERHSTWLGAAYMDGGHITLMEEGALVRWEPNLTWEWKLLHANYSILIVNPDGGSIMLQGWFSSAGKVEAFPILQHQLKREPKHKKRPTKSTLTAGWILCATCMVTGWLLIESLLKDPDTKRRKHSINTT